MRSAVLKAAWFMDKAEYTEKLNALNAELKALPAAKWNGVKVVTSGIICDNPVLLKVFKDNNVAIAADDVAHESRAFRTDASEEGDPMTVVRTMMQIRPKNTVPMPIRVTKSGLYIDSSYPFR